jgi:hypothetical protein
MTASDMVTEIRLWLGGETSETISDNQILRWINRSYIELASAYKFDELETSTSVSTTSGTAEYAIPSTGADDILKVISMTDDTNNVTMFPTSRWQYDRWVSGDATNQTGTPIYWINSGVGDNSDSPAKTVKQFTFYPTPDGTYTINVIYLKKPTELVLSPSATSAVIREPWDDVILQRAVSRGWRGLGDDDKAYKALQAARDSEKAAVQSSFTASYVPFRPGSVVGRAL